MNEAPEGGELGLPKEGRQSFPSTRRGYPQDCLESLRSLAHQSNHLVRRDHLEGSTAPRTSSTPGIHPATLCEFR